jgi:hypothetical protein
MAITLATSNAVGAQTPEPLGITVREAQTLPAKELAKRLLGDVGAALVVDVDRPTWESELVGPGLRPPKPQPWPPPDPPPMPELVFYTHPRASNQFGLCSETVITISFDSQDGDASPEGGSPLQM